MAGFNPFDAETTVSRRVARPRVRVAEVNEAGVILEVEHVDEDGVPVLILQRACLRVGDTLTLKDVSINIEVTMKE